jgi:predicted  nucleic acid-binding Zn-ribbon protein
MIDEVYLNEAVRIRRTYLKLSSNMEIYQKKAQEVIKTLDLTISKIDALHERASSKSDDSNAQSLLSALMKILDDVDDEGKSLENLVSPLNSNIEKLALEEQELYRQIKERHHVLTEEQILESVRTRLISENL